VFERSEKATREWVGAGLDLDLTLLQLVMSDGFQATRFGSYLRALSSHFEGVVVADMFCLLRIELELAVQAKAWLIAHEAGLDLPVDDDLRAALAERDHLRQSIGRTGLLALEPLRVTSDRDYWNRPSAGARQRRAATAIAWCTEGEAVKYLLLLFLITIGVNWPELPYNARLADVIFSPLALAVLHLVHSALRTPPLSWHWSDLAVAGYLLGAVPAILISDDRRASAIELVRELYLVAIYVVFAIAARRGWRTPIGKGLALGGAILASAGLVVVALHLIGVAPPPLFGEVMPLPYIGATLRLRSLTVTFAMFACVLTAAAPFAIARCAQDRVRAWCALTGVMIVAALLTFSHAIAGFAVAVLLAAWPSLASRPRLRRLAIAGVADHLPRPEFRGDRGDQVGLGRRRGLCRHVAVLSRCRSTADEHRRRHRDLQRDELRAHQAGRVAHVRRTSDRRNRPRPFSRRHGAGLHRRDVAVALSRDRSALDAAGPACGKRRHRRHHAAGALGGLGGDGARRRSGRRPHRPGRRRGARRPDRQQPQRRHHELPVCLGPGRHPPRPTRVESLLQRLVRK
jgi:hypothetical protein